MRIDRNLNLVVPVEVEPEQLNDKDEVIRPARHYYVHAAPISLETFEENVFLLAKTFNKVLAAGARLGPRIAASLLKQTAAEIFGDGERVSGAFLAEVRRLCVVAVPSERGYEPVPLDEAVRTGGMDGEDVSHVENAIVFFSLAWRAMPKAERTILAQGGAAFYGGSTTSSNCTDYARSLTTSTPPASTGARPAVPPGTVLDAGRPSSLPT